MTDYYYVDCEEYREALSARLDDEEGPEDARQPPDLHLEFCGECALWYDDAALITRRARTTVAVAWPDVTEAVLARVPAVTSIGPTRLRLSLGAVGTMQVASALLTLALHGAGNETATWNLALGVAFSTIAVRHTRPAGLVPLLGVFVATLSWGQVSDLLAGRPSPGGVLSLVLAVIGLGLVVLLGRMPPAPRGQSPR